MPEQKDPLQEDYRVLMDHKQPESSLLQKTTEQMKAAQAVKPPSAFVWKRYGAAAACLLLLLGVFSAFPRLKGAHLIGTNIAAYSSNPLQQPTETLSSGKAPAETIASDRLPDIILNPVTEISASATNWFAMRPETHEEKIWHEADFTAYFGKLPSPVLPTDLKEVGDREWPVVYRKGKGIELDYCGYLYATQLEDDGWGHMLPAQGSRWFSVGCSKLGIQQGIVYYAGVTPKSTVIHGQAVILGEWEQENQYAATFKKKEIQYSIRSGNLTLSEFYRAIESLILQ